MQGLLGLQRRRSLGELTSYQGNIWGREFGGIDEKEVGPVERKLGTFPFHSLVFGAWNEASPDVHELIHIIARAKCNSMEGKQEDGFSRRKLEYKAELAMTTGQVRRSLSLISAQAQSRCLLDRVEVLGAGTREAKNRRRWVKLEERRMWREQKAHQLSMQMGRPVLRRGEFYLQWTFIVLCREIFTFLKYL